MMFGGERHGHCLLGVIVLTPFFFHLPSFQSQMLTLLSVEVHVHTRDDLYPNPAYDPVQCIFYCVHNDPQEDDSAATTVVGALSVREVRSVQRGPSPPEVDDLEDLISGGGSSSSRGRAPGGGRAPPKECGLLRRSGVTNLTVSEVAGEVELFAALVELVRRCVPSLLWEGPLRNCPCGKLSALASSGADNVLLKCGSLIFTSRRNSRTVVRCDLSSGKGVCGRRASCRRLPFSLTVHANFAAKSWDATTTAMLSFTHAFRWNTHDQPSGWQRPTI